MKRKNNKEKFEIFLEVGKGLNRVFNIVPVLFGSLGLYKKIGEYGQANDIDILIPEELINKRWGELIYFMQDLGFKLADQKEHEFSREGESVGFARQEDLPKKAGINPSNLEISNKDGVVFKELTAEQFLKVYELMLRDKYRQEKLGKDDKKKIELIENYIEKSWSEEA